jgi:membrane protein
LPGAIFASVGWIFLSLIFSYYVNNFSNYSQFYGSIGAVIILMLWLLISSIIIILGGEVNSIYIKNKYFF